MDRWKEDISTALFGFDKPITLATIYTAVKHVRLARGEENWPASAEEIIRRTLQASSSDSSWFKPSQEDLFQNTEIGKGIWVLRDRARTRIQFKRWLHDQGKSDRTVEAYAGAIGTIGQELTVFTKSKIDLYTLQNIVDLEEMRRSYFAHAKFFDKNVRGNNMYSSAFQLYIEYIQHLHDEIIFPLFDKMDVTEISVAERVAIEGEIIERKVLTYKRNQQNVLACKLRDNYTCVACGYFYKNLIVEAHHIVPLAHSQITIVKIEDLITLCPTCHRLAHSLLRHDNSLQQREILVAKLKEERAV